MATTVRRDIVANPVARDAYVEGVLRLKNERTRHLTSAFGIPGEPAPVHTYDLFVIWHHKTMKTPVPPGGDSGIRNAAHRGPVFLPWHRVVLRFLEINLARALRDPGFGLPYWDWTADGSATDPVDAPIWDPCHLGGQGDPVETGPFTTDNGFRVRIENSPDVAPRQTDRGLRRRFRGPNGTVTLPSPADLTALFDDLADPTLAEYDRPEFDRRSAGFRNRLEGFVGTGMHNQVHRWVDGDMVPASSPNDPVFFLHHCNVDRMWEAWMQRHGRVYVPDATAPADLEGHRIDDPMVSPLGAAGTPRCVLDASRVGYAYDVLP